MLRIDLSDKSGAQEPELQRIRWYQHQLGVREVTVLRACTVLQQKRRVDNKRSYNSAATVVNRAPQPGLAQLMGARRAGGRLWHTSSTRPGNRQTQKRCPCTCQ